MTSDASRALTAFAVIAAAATCFAAVSVHALEVQSGYELARARREARRLDRELRQAEQAVAALRSPAAVRATALALGLPVDYPRHARELDAAHIRFHRDATDAERRVVVQVEAR